MLTVTSLHDDLLACVLTVTLCHDDLQARVLTVTLLHCDLQVCMLTVTLCHDDLQACVLTVTCHDDLQTCVLTVTLLHDDLQACVLTVMLLDDDLQATPSPSIAALHGSTPTSTDCCRNTLQRPSCTSATTLHLMTTGECVSGISRMCFCKHQFLGQPACCGGGGETFLLLEIIDEIEVQGTYIQNTSK